MATGTNYSSQTEQPSSTRVVWLQYQMYIEKFDMMRMVDYVEKQINECLNGSRTMTNEDLMCDIIEKMNFYTQHNALEKILLARELVWTFGLNRKFESWEQYHAALTELLNKFMLSGDTYWFFVIITCEFDVEMKQPESHQSQTAAEHPAAEKKQTGDCGNNYSADKVSEEQNNPEVENDASENKEPLAPPNRFTAPEEEHTRVADTAGSDSQQHHFSPAERNDADDFEGIETDADSIELENIKIQPIKSDEDKTVTAEISSTEQHSIGIQCDSSSTLKFSACLKLMWKSIKKFCRQTFVKLIVCKSDFNAEENLMSCQLSL